MIYLLEHEVGFDPESVGFPSISGCIAIVFQTTSGLYGYHNAGGSAETKFEERAQLFADYVNQHFIGKGAGLHLYGTSFVGDNRRGYRLGKALQDWKKEMKTFAAALGFKGRISGYDLEKTTIGGSAYVEYTVDGAKCKIKIKPWSEAGKQTGPNLLRWNHKKVVGSIKVPMNVVTAVDTTGALQVNPQKLG